MKYTYAYKTSDGKRHEDSMEAESREAVFSALRKRRISPIKVVAADGSKANGEERAPRIAGLRRRLLATGAVCLALGAAAAVFLMRGPVRKAHIAGGGASETASPRHQIYGDPAIVETFDHGHFETYLPRRGDALLAWFAQPGRLLCPKGTSHGMLLHPSDADIAALAAVAKSDLALAAEDSREVRELKQIINGMHAELRAYLANGNGTVRSYWRRLQERNREEAMIAERTRRELENETNAAVWEEKNAALRRLGLRTIPNPKESE